MDNLNFLINENNIEKYKNQTPFQFDQNIPFDLSWDEIFLLLDQDINNMVQTNQDYYKGYGFKLKKADRLEPIAQIIDVLFKIFNPSKIAKNTRPSDAQHIYINLTTDQSLNNAPHMDKDNVFFWQLQGKTRWEIYDENNEEVQYTFELSPGNMIYCPKHRKHRVISLTPRAGASIGFNSLR